MPKKCLHGYALKLVEDKSLELRKALRTRDRTVSVVRKVRKLWRHRIEFLKPERKRGSAFKTFSCTRLFLTAATTRQWGCLSSKWKKNPSFTLSLFPQARAKTGVYSVRGDSDSTGSQQCLCFQKDFMCLTFIVNGALKFYHLP